jgi:hypothetical protein
MVINHLGARATIYHEEIGVGSVIALDPNSGFVIAKHYVTWERTGATVTLSLYSDPERTSLLAAATTRDDATAYRYLHFTNGRGGADVDTVTGYVQNVLVTPAV